MQSLGSSINFDRYEHLSKRNKAPHTKAALVDEIIKVVGKSPAYNYGFWLKRVKLLESKGGSPGTILGWLKQIDDYPDDFNKGAILNNKIKKYGTIESGRTVPGDDTKAVSNEEGKQVLAQDVVQVSNGH
jgi:hypothetical protein